MNPLDSLTDLEARAQFLGYLGLFGMMINGLESGLHDHAAIANIDMNWEVGLLLTGFTLCMFLFATAVPWVLQRTGAVFLNLSLLTSDLYGVLYWWLTNKNWHPTGLYAVAYNFSFFISFFFV